MALFKKSRPRPPSPVKEKVAKSIANKLVSMQLGAAKRLQNWQARSSVKKRNIVLLLFALAWFGYCTYLFIATIISWLRM